MDIRADGSNSQRRFGSLSGHTWRFRGSMLRILQAIISYAQLSPTFTCLLN